MGGYYAVMIIADTHLHIYPEYDFAEALREYVVHLTALAPSALCAGFMAERSDCHIYRSLADGDKDNCLENIALKVLDNGSCLELQCFNTAPLYLLPGRQIVTAEKLELLCLGVDADIPDGLPAETAVHRIREVGGIAVLTWAVGKWLFKRAAVVDELLKTFSPQELMIGDSAMRPVFWPTPRPMRFARKNGYRIIAGSDPLPAAGEEKVMGSYASLFTAEFNPEKPSLSLKSALHDPDTAIKTVGSRSGIFEFFQRMANSR
jgi:hypothetical protein